MASRNRHSAKHKLSILIARFQHLTKTAHCLTRDIHEPRFRHHAKALLTSFDVSNT